jgi:hypothetical protein
LTQYCRRKVETRLERIVGKKVKKAIEKADQKRREEERKAIKKGNLDPSQTRPTLPKLDHDDDASTVISLQRSDTMSTNTTLPPYSANGPARTNTMSTNRTAMNPTLPSLNERPNMPTRSNTQYTNYSNSSYRSNAPLLDQAGAMGTATPANPMPPIDRNRDYFGQPPAQPYPPSNRPFTPSSQGRASPMPLRAALPPVDTSYSSNNRFESDPQLISPLPSDLRGPSPAQSTRPYPEFSPFDTREPQAGQSYELSPVDNTPSSNDPLDYYTNSNTSDEYRAPQIPSALRAGSPALQNPQGGLPYPQAGLPPPRAGTAPPRPGIPASLQSAIQRREASQPLPNRGMTGSVPQQRSATAPIQQPSWNSGNVDRSYTPATQQGYDQGYNQSYRY